MLADATALHTLILFAAARIAVALSPGPVNVVLLAHILRSDVSGSVAVATGASLGSLLLLALVCSGLPGAHPEASVLTVILKWAGVAYLLRVAWKMGFPGVPRNGPASFAPSAPSISRPLATGIVTSIANPASFLFFLAVVPGLVATNAIGPSDFILLAAVNLGVLAGVYGAMILIGLRAWNRTSLSFGAMSVARSSAALVAFTAVWIALR